MTVRSYLRERERQRKIHLASGRHRRRLVTNIGGGKKIWGKFIFRPDSERLKNFEKSSSDDLFLVIDYFFLNVLPLLQLFLLLCFGGIFYFLLGSFSILVFFK